MESFIHFGKKSRSFPINFQKIRLTIQFLLQFKIYADHLKNMETKSLKLWKL